MLDQHCLLTLVKIYKQHPLKAGNYIPDVPRSSELHYFHIEAIKNLNDFPTGRHRREPKKNIKLAAPPH